MVPERDSMDAERWIQVENLFHRALAAGPVQRGQLLDAECRGDDALRAQVERLLAADERPHELVDQLDSGALRPPEDPLIGREIGAYRIIDRIAAGGMGVVYRAERTDGLFDHEVAIKLIRSELASDNLIRRFEFERRTLASLHHPHIAQLFDGGATPDGRSYLVMELVRGLPIDIYCDRNGQSIEQRLRLFAEVCRAVHFAHQSLVVHRDLKPANILIDGNGVPKLLDFGIARLLDEDRQAPAIGLTQTGGQILTPEYASPEHISGGAITTAMDVYSLGVVLYELLTGLRPFPSDYKSPIEWHRDVSERAPTRPSSIVVRPETIRASEAAVKLDLAELAARRGCNPRTLQRRLRGDIDRIVLMALRKEPERRYPSARDMAEDIERHFSGHPLLARGDSVGYRATKFVRRNRLAVGAATAVLVALVAGILLARRGEQRARAEALHARVEAESFQGIADFLMDAFLTSAPSLDQDQLEQKRRRIFAQAARLRREYVDEDHLRANLLDSLGRVAGGLGLFDDAEALVAEALAIRERAFGQKSLEYALSLRSLGQLRHAKGELGSATELLEKALVLHRESPRETHTDVASVANDLAACLRGQGRLDEADALHREALALRRESADGSLAVAESLNNLAGVHLDRNDFAAAARALEEALLIRRRILSTENGLTLQSMSNLAMTRWRMGERKAAYELLDEVEKHSRELRVDGEEGLAQALSNRAGMLMAEGDFASAEPLVAEALELQLRRLGPTNPAVATTLTRQARLQLELKRTADARASWERVLEIRRTPDASPRYLAQSLYEFGGFLCAIQAPQEARAAYSEAIEVLLASGSERSASLARIQVALGELLLSLGDAAGAKPHLAEAVSTLAAAPAGLEQDLAQAQAALMRCEAASDH